MSLPQSLHAAAKAKLAGRLQGFDLAVLIVLWGILDVYHFRQLKASVLRVQLTVAGSEPPNEANIRRAIRHLEHQGYIERGQQVEGIWTFRLLVSPPARRSPVTPESVP